MRIDKGKEFEEFDEGEEYKEQGGPVIPGIP